jgi:hypothetical protein
MAKNRLVRILGKKEKPQSPLPFSITILVDPVSGGIRWNPIFQGPVPYALIYQGLDKCRAYFALQEAAESVQAEMAARQKKNPSPPTSTQPTVPGEKTLAPPN